jgi:hypothetical protein
MPSSRFAGFVTITRHKFNAWYSCFNLLFHRLLGIGAVCALHEHHAAHTCCKLLKKCNNTNLSERQHNKCEVFQTVKVPYGRVKFPNR